MPVETVKRIRLPELHAVQQQIVSELARFSVLNCGRRFGKDILAINHLIEGALDQQQVAWFAPTYKQLTEVWRVVANVIEPVTRRRSEQQHRAELLTGGVIDMWSLDQPDTARGRAYNRVIINEAAMVARLQEAWEQVIRPTLTDYHGTALFLSTPKGFNFFKTVYDRGQDGEQPDWQSWTFPTSANPYIDPVEIEAARRELPESVFSQEYLAAFIADETAVFRGLLHACVLDPNAPIEGHTYVVGCDWGKLNDFSVFSVVDATTREQVYIDRSNRIDYTMQVGRLKALCERYRVRAVIAEANSMGQAIIEQVQRARIPVLSWTATQVTKQQMIEALALSIEQGQIKLLRDAVQMAELQAFTATKTPSGLLRYAAPEGQHDDTVIALGLAHLGARVPHEQSRLVDFRVEAG
jgi:hypothetical protein